MRGKKIRLGDLLVQQQLISEKQLQQAIFEQKKVGSKLGKVLISLGFISEDALLKILSEQLNIPYIDLKNYEYNPELIRKLPETIARRCRALLLKEEGASVLVGLSDPLDIHAYDQLSRALKRPIKLALVREQDLLHSIDVVYRHREQMSGFAEALSDELSEAEIDITKLGDELGAQDAPVVKLLQTLFEDAGKMNASDIHIEPDENMLRIRQRIDGVLQEHIMHEHRISSALIQRLKIMASLNIAERRLPQDGHFTIRIGGGIVDVRLSTMPTNTGESAVLRLLDQTKSALNLDCVGLQEKQLQRIRELIHAPHGMILVTGPTGSGKTTTLYSILSELNVPEKKIITVEDPIEYQLPRVNQVQVNSGIQLDFSRVLRAALRQDPDILLVGEIRDVETARIALRAAMTGHLVFSTLHTNDAVSSAMRLVDMEVEGYLVATALKAVLAQRLIRKICENCIGNYDPDPQERAWLEATGIGNYQDLQFKYGSGCNQCHMTGYSGRIGVFELLEPDFNMLNSLRQHDLAGFAQAAEAREDFLSLGVRALQLALEAQTSLEEVIRVAGEPHKEYDNCVFDQ